MEIMYKKKNYKPSKIICVGMNYVDHIRELKDKMPGELVLFIKPGTAISDQIELPDKKNRYEGEISFLTKGGRFIGVGFGIDLTLPEEQKRLKEKGLPWEKCKAFDNSAIFSEFVEIEQVDDLKLELWINNKLRQSGGIGLMIHKPAEILSEINDYFTLENYDIVMTGTPNGVGELKKGDTVTGKIYSGEKLLVEKEWIAK